MEPFYEFVKNFGFPVALSCYLLLRFEKVLNDLVKKVGSLEIILNNIMEVIKKCRKK